MTKQQSRKLFLFLILLISNLFLTNKIFAANLTLNPSKEEVGRREQFYIDLMLDTEGKSINAIQGSITFPSDKVSYIRALDGKSMINLWVEKPKLNADTINFAGIMTNGFEGVIDPFNLQTKLPGLMIRLVFEAKDSGKADFSTSAFSLNLNDGEGTEIISSPSYLSINIGDFTREIKYKSEGSGTPQLEAYITRDPNIFNNGYTLIFKATDKDSGIKSVRIKEGRRDWKEIESPYLLVDQSRHSKISLQAINYSGGGVIVNIDKIPYDWDKLISIGNTIIISLILLILVIKIKKKYVDKK